MRHTQRMLSFMAAGLLLAAALALPRPAQAAGPCAAACTVCGGNCSKVRCICDADGGQLRTCGQCSDNDYMCINSCGPVDIAEAAAPPAGEPAFFAAPRPEPAAGLCQAPADQPTAVAAGAGAG